MNHKDHTPMKHYIEKPNNIMKKVKTLMMAAIAIFCTAGASAQNLHDITTFYITNAGFDTDFDYTIHDTGNVAPEIL